jgi:hypothetical protein
MEEKASLAPSGIYLIPINLYDSSTRQKSEPKPNYQITGKNEKDFQLRHANKDKGKSVVQNRQAMIQKQIRFYPLCLHELQPHQVS